MAEAPNFPEPTGADHGGSAGGDVGRVRPGESAEDPIFQRTQPPTKTQKSTVLIWQFFLVPLLIVVGALAVFLLFGAFAGSEDTPDELLTALLQGGGNEKQQAAHQLGLAINEEYRRVQRQDIPDPPPFYSEPSFQRGMARALEIAIDDRDEPTIQFVSLSLGEIQSEAGVPLLVSVLYPDDERAFGDDTRRRATIGMTFYDGREAEGALVRASSDKRDAQVRSIALSGLARLGRPGVYDETESPSVVRALRLGLDDDLPGARLNAAVGLGFRGIGDERVIAILKQALTREGLNQMVVPPELQPQALRNASKAAAALGTPELKELVERLADPTVEGDDLVRQTAREALTRWNTES